MVNVSNNALLTFLYFIQGLPYGIQSQFLPIYLNSKTHLSVSKISFLKFLSIPWLFKFVWGPLVDSFSTKRRWLCVTSIILCLVCFIGSIVTPQNIFLISCLLFLLNLFTSIQDVVVDATSMSLLTTEDIAIGNVAQVVGYKLGSVFSGGILTSFVDVIGWTALFNIIAAFYFEAAMFVFVSPTFYSYEQRELFRENGKTRKNRSCDLLGGESRQVEICESKLRPRDAWNFVYKVFSEGETLWMVVFLLTYKLGEQGALSILPLYLLHKGVSSDDVIFWMSLIGQSLSIFGSIAGGFLTKCTSRMFPTEFLLQQVCLLRLLPIGCQLLIIISWDYELISKQFLLYASVASSQLLLLLSGIVTTTTFTLMMQLSKRAPPEIQATHYATMSTMEVLGKLLFISIAGWIVDTTDYNVAFLLFALLNVLILPVFNKIPHSNSKASCTIEDETKKSS